MSPFVRMALVLLVTTGPVHAADTTVQVERFPFTIEAVPEASCGTFDVWFDMKGVLTWKSVWSTDGTLLEDLTVAQFTDTYYDPLRPDRRLESLTETQAFQVDWTTLIGENHGAVMKVMVPGYGFFHTAGTMVVDFGAQTVVRDWSVGSRQALDAALCAYFGSL